MAKEKRKTDGRRDSASSADRRRKNDRRDADRRGLAEGVREKRPARAKSKSWFALASFYKVIAALFMLSIATFSLIFIIFIGNLEYFMGKAGERILISVDRVSVDPAHLTDRSSKANINLRIENKLPVNIVLQNLNFSVLLSGYTIAKDATFMPKTLIKGNSVATVPIWCQVDSIMMRRGLQKGLQSSSSKNNTSTLALSSGKDSITNDIKNMTRIKGTVEFRFSAGGAEIPFLRHFEFAQN